MPLHKKVPIAGQHKAHAFEYADAAARLAATPTAEDVGKLALQLDDYSLWLLQDDAPLTWTPAGPGTGGFIKADGSVPFTGDQSMDGHKITDLPAASGSGEAVRFDEFSLVAGDLSTAQGDITDLENHNALVEGDTKEPTGFTLAQRVRTSLSFDDGTQTFTLTPLAVDAAYWYQGALRAIAAPKTLVLSSDEGMHHIYLGADDALHEFVGFDPAFFTEHASVATIYWDSVGAKAIYFGDERHGCRMDGDTHTLLHFTIGPTIGVGGGLALLDVVADGDGSTDDHCQLGVEAGYTADQDIVHAHSTDAKPATMGGYYLLTVAPGVHVFRELAAGDYPFGVSGGHACYNDYSGGSWSLQPLADGEFMCSHVFATNDATRPFAFGVGRAKYASLALAFEGAGEELKALTQLIITTMPCAEFVPLGTIILKHDHAYGNTYKVAVQSTPLGDDWIDWRFSKLSVAVPTASLIHTHLANDIVLPALGAPEMQVRLHQAYNRCFSPLSCGGFTLSDNGDGTVDLTYGEAVLRDGASTSDLLQNVFIAATSALALTDGEVNYVYAEWNGGSPQVAASTTQPMRQDTALLYVIARDGTTLDVADVRAAVVDAPGRINDLATAVLGWRAAIGGSVPSEPAALKLAITAGVGVAGTVAIPHSAFDSTGADRFTLAYQDGGGGFTYVAAQASFDVANYDDGTGVLAALTPGNYGVAWVYLVLEGTGRVVVVYGQGDYPDLGSAYQAREPAAALLPPCCRPLGVALLVGKAVFEQGSAALEVIDVPYAAFALQGGGAGSPGTTIECVTCHDAKAAGTHGGTSTADTWSDRTLGTLTKAGTETWISLAANTMTLSAGTYLVHASAPAVGAGRHQLRIRRTDVAGTELVGQSMLGAYFNEEDTSTAVLDGLLVVPGGGGDYKLQHWVERGVANYGFGHAASRSGSDGPQESEMYARVVLTKVG